MRLFGKVDGGVNRFDRAEWLTPPFDIAFKIPPPAPSSGSNLLRKGMARLTATLKQHASEEIQYTRGDEYVFCRATLGRKLLKLDDGVGGFQIVWTDMDFLIPTDDLVIDGERVTPESGHIVRVTIGGEVQRYEVAQYGGEPCWTWAEPHQSMLRVHTKRVGVEAYS